MSTASGSSPPSVLLCCHDGVRPPAWHMERKGSQIAPGPDCLRAAVGSGNILLLRGLRAGARAKGPHVPRPRLLRCTHPPLTRYRTERAKGSNKPPDVSP